MRLLIAALLLLIGLFAAAPAAPAAAQSVAGEWDAAMNTPGGVRAFKVIFEVHGDSLSGTVRREAGDVPLVGTVRGDLVEFRYIIDYRGNSLPLAVRARVNGDYMEGIVDMNGVAEEEFTARRSGTMPAIRSGG